MSDVLFWAAIGLGAIVAYEVLRALVVRAVARRMRRRAQEFVRRHDVRLDQFKFMNKVFIEAELMNDPDLNRRIVAAAQAEGRTVYEVRTDVASWIDEIVPFFNLSSYFKLGQPIAAAALRSVYDVRVDQASLERVGAKIPADAVLVYVMNHRSNADYILVAYMLRKKIALSYAVGEWARVWPLEWLFKSFGSYFIRRRFRNELYHAVLEKYVQLISRRGVSQGVFPEGGLSRDGLLREPKVGILGYVAAIKSDPSFTQDLYFVPVGINYDHVLEDRALLDELSGRRKGPLRLAQKMVSLLWVLTRLPLTLFINLGRRFMGRVKRHGYASVSFGEPISLGSWLERAPTFGAMSRDERKPVLKDLASDLMRAIGAVVPASPVPIVARALLDLGETKVTRERLKERVREVRDVLTAHGARFVGGQRLRALAAERERLDDERDARRPELVDVDESLLGWDEAEATVAAGLYVLGGRGLVRRRGDSIEVRPHARRILEYYAGSIAQLL
jgi:glycerol-3-phosphate O-acyltransferase